MPMIISDVTSIDLRPMRSPKWPKTMPPSGRAAKPTAKVPKADERADQPARRSGKNSSPKTSAAAVP